MTDQKVLLIAGGSGSIGSAIARHALSHGWKVALHGRTQDKVEAAVTGLSYLGTIDGFLTDIWEEDAAETLVAEVAEQYGRIDAVIDCTTTSPVGIAGLFPETAPETFGDFLNVSVGWIERLAHASYDFLAQEGGTLIAFVSNSGIFAAARQSLIGAAQAGVIGFVRNFAMDAAADGIRAHVLAPGFVEGTYSAARLDADRTAKSGRRAGLGTPTADDIAPIALFLCGDGAAKITGQVININGGLNA